MMIVMLMNQLPLGLGGGDGKFGSSFILLISSSIVISNISNTQIYCYNN